MGRYNSKVALLGGCIDYAGTFPPASLSLPESIKKAAAFRSSSKQPFLLGKIALPIEDLKKLSPRFLIDCGADGSAWLFTALGSFTADGVAEDFARQVEWEMREIRRCNERGFESSCRQWICAYESRLPSSITVLTDGDRIYDFIAPILDRFSSFTHSQLSPYFEIPFGADWSKSASAISEALVRWVDNNPETQLVPGIKVRTGGALVPSTEQLASAVQLCVSRGLRFKATQGLHRALTTKSADGRDAHGFVNLFAALAFAQLLGGDAFGLKEIGGCLDSDSPKDFQFGESALRWLDYEIDCDAIEAARRQHAATFGSCSLDEPDDDLAGLFK